MIEPIDTAPKDGSRILCLCADGRTQYCWWVGCNEAEGFWMTEREATPRAWYSNKRLPPEGPAVTPAADDRGPGSVAPDASPVATDEHIADVFERIAGWRYNYPHTLDALRAIYNLGREHGAANAKQTPNPSQAGSSDTTPTAPDRPLWKLMQNAYEAVYTGEHGPAFAAELENHQ